MAGSLILNDCHICLEDENYVLLKDSSPTRMPAIPCRGRLTRGFIANEQSAWGTSIDGIAKANWSLANLALLDIVTR
jgi:hypothetical protein